MDAVPCLEVMQEHPCYHVPSHTSVDASVALDTRGNPHIAYGEDTNNQSLHRDRQD
jgi:hypothetical protein